MARFNLAHIARARSRKRGRRTFRPITPTSALAADLAAIYLPVVREWQAAIDPLLAEYERTLAAITTDSAADMQRVVEQTESGLLRLFLTLAPRLRDWALRVERWHRDKWIGAALSASGIDLSTLLTVGDVQETVGTVVARNVELVRNVSDQARSRMADIVFRGVQQRKAARDVAAELRESVAMSRRRALNIAADQAQKLTSELDTQRMAQAGVEKFKYFHSGKVHPRSWHLKRDGRIYDLETWKEIGGDDVIEVGDRPGEPPFCGCKKLAVIEWDDE